MINARLKYFLLLLFCLPAAVAMAQFSGSSTTGDASQQDRVNHMRDTTTTPKDLTGDQMIDTLRKKEKKKRDSVIFSAKYIKWTNEALLNDSTQIFRLDTGLNNFENYSPLYQPHSPKTGLGNLGLAERNLLFEPSHTIGFDVGVHYLDAYLLHPSDITYYRARTPLTVLYMVTSGVIEQVFQVVHTQNIKPNWNFGVNYNRIGSQGLYSRQGTNHLSAAIFSWYESRNKRYNVLGNLFFNNLKSPENGSITNDNIFDGGSSLLPTGEPIRLYNSSDNLRDNGFYLKQFYYLGRVDSTRSSAASASKILPTQRVAYTFFYNVQKYKFFQNDVDTYNVFPAAYYDQQVSTDSMAVLHLQNEVSYSFYLRGQSVSFVKNELKLDLGLKHDYYSYSQWVRDTSAATGIPQLDQKQQNSLQDVTLKAKLSYRFSNRMGLDAELQQITVGHDAGDYFYDAKLNLSGGNKVGKIILEGYTQNSSAPLIYTSWNTNHYRWTYTFKNVRTTGLSFNYINPRARLNFKAEYFLISNYLYFGADSGSNNALPTQLKADINLIKLSLGKNFVLGRWRSENFLVFQKSDYQNTLRTPTLYAYASINYNREYFSVLNTSIGLNVRYNTPYQLPSYAVGLGQFYNSSPVKFASYPVASVFIKGTIKQTNLFLQYDYANQGLLSNGYYTINRYPMPGAMLKFGVRWYFYD